MATVHGGALQAAQIQDLQVIQFPKVMDLARTSGTERVVDEVFQANEYKGFVRKVAESGLEVVSARTIEHDGIVKSRVDVNYYNIPCAFDIEASSWRNEAGAARATMFCWQFAVNGYVIMGRTWNEWLTVLDELRRVLELGPLKRLMIYVHNLAYEFGWIHKFFIWRRVFAVKERTPLQAITDDGLEFRCSYLLSGLSLDAVGKELLRYKCRKAKGDLDYYLMRHSYTPLSRKEIYYCVCDVAVVSAYIAECIEAEGDISKIPLTKTGYVRRFMREECIGYDKRGKAWRMAKNYRELIHEMNLSLEDYEMARQSFQGGFTHANAWASGHVMKEVYSQDFCSSYPAVMVSEEYPMGPTIQLTEKVKTEEDLLKYSQKYCMLLDVGFVGVCSKRIQERILSASRCTDLPRNAELDNGRIVRADHLRCVITNVDYVCLREFYEIEEVSIFRVIGWKKGYLPTAFVRALLSLYKDKTELKGVSGMEFLYNLKKAMVNSAYGMIVTDIIRAIIDYDTMRGEWKDPVKTEKIPKNDKIDLIEEANNSKNRFTFYPQGVFVTSYARRNLYGAILALGSDYLYSDTDSVKYTNHAKHAAYFAAYNAMMERKMEKAMRCHGFDRDLWRPKTIKGKEKPLGFWEREPDMLLFKTLGAKRYMYLTKSPVIARTEYKGNVYEKAVVGPTGKPLMAYEIHLTLAGVNKKTAAKWLVETFGKYGAFQAFSNKLVVPAEAAGKLIHTYIDNDTSGVLVDYMGVPAEYQELSSVCLEASTYNLKIDPDYLAIDDLLSTLCFNYDS